MGKKLEYIADLNDVFSKAKKTLGISQSQFEKLLQKHEIEIKTKFDAFRVPCNKLIKIWEDLYIPYLAIYFGYNESEHIKEIANRINTKTFNHNFSYNISKPVYDFIESQVEIKSTLSVLLNHTTNENRDFTLKPSL